MRNNDMLFRGSCHPGVDQRPIAIIQFQAVLAGNLLDTKGSLDPCHVQQLGHHSLAHLIVGQSVEIDFVDSAAGGQQQDRGIGGQHGKAPDREGTLLAQIIPCRNRPIPPAPSLRRDPVLPSMCRLAA